MAMIMFLVLFAGALACGLSDEKRTPDQERAADDDQSNGRPVLQIVGYQLRGRTRLVSLVAHDAFSVRTSLP